MRQEQRLNGKIKKEGKFARLPPAHRRNQKTQKRARLLRRAHAKSKPFLLFFGFFGHFYVFQFFNQAQQSGLQFCDIFLLKGRQALFHAGNQPV